MTQEELNKVTLWIKENVAENGYFLSMQDEAVKDDIKASEVIFSLHNLLYKEVTGESYDYWFHWTNKVGFDGYREQGFNPDVKEEVFFDDTSDS